MQTIDTQTGEVTALELQSPEVSELAKALVKAQAAMTSAQKDGSNPHFKSSYATLDSIWQAIRKPLCEHGLCVVQSLLPDNTLVTTLLHESGQWVRSYQRLNPVQNSPQGIGSALTYGRRYSLAAIVGICQADDDGEEGSITTTDKRLAVPLGEKKPKPTQAPSPATVPQATAKTENGDQRLAIPPGDKAIIKPYRFPSTAAAKFFEKVQSVTDNHYKDGADLQQTLGGWFDFGNAELWNERLSYACDMARQPA